MMVVLLLMLLIVCVDLLKLVVFDFELIDISLLGEFYGLRFEEVWFVFIGEQLCGELMKFGKFEVFDIVLVRDVVCYVNLQVCGGCDLKFVGELGVEFEIIGMVQKVLNLIINFNIYLWEVKIGVMIMVVSVDMCGNIDEVWICMMSYLICNRLLVFNYGKWEQEVVNYKMQGG